MRTLSNDDVEAIVERLAEKLGTAFRYRAIEPTEVYTVEEAAMLAMMHAETLREKLLACVIESKRRVGVWRVRGSEPMNIAGTTEEQKGPRSPNTED